MGTLSSDKAKYRKVGCKIEGEPVPVVHPDCVQIMLPATTGELTSAATGRLDPTSSLWRQRMAASARFSSPPAPELGRSLLSSGGRWADRIDRIDRPTNAVRQVDGRWIQTQRERMK